MWTYIIAPLLIMLAMFALLLAVPVCLGMLLRLLMRQTRPSFVAWFGAALGLTAQYGTGDHGSMMRSVTNVLPFAGYSPLTTLSLGAIGLLIPLALWFMFVKWGVELVDRYANQQSGRLWLVMCPVMAVTIYAGLVFGLMSLYVGTGSHGRCSYLFALLFRFFLWELLLVLCAAFTITMLYVNRRKQKTPDNMPEDIGDTVTHGRPVP